MNMLAKTFILISLLSSLLVITGLIDFSKVKAQQQEGALPATGNGNGCISYDSVRRLITVSCKSATLTDIYNQLNDPAVLNKEQQQRNGVWLLNANLTINKGATLTIDPTDTAWLKIIADGRTLAYGIHVLGSLKIDSVKLTSWNPETNYYAMSNGSRESSGPATKACGNNCPIAVKDKLTHHGAPRPYIRIESSATGTTNITNSYIGYIGYEAGWGKMTPGLQYNSGNGSVIRNNDFDHLYIGFYSVNVGNMVIENNKIHNSGHYGIDPHTGTHDMVIRNNIVYDNNGTAIICSLNCYNIRFEKNNSSSVIIVDDVFFKPYIVAIQRTDYGCAIIIIHNVIPNYHVMGTCVRIYAVMSAVMYLVVLDNHITNIYRIKSKIQMIKVIVPYYAAMARIILQPGRHFAPSCFISYVSDVRVGDICSTCCATFNSYIWSWGAVVG